ncbi:NifU-like protein 1, chloroplastic [Seminavis robusta]|uniref:NifU-like protein 1, chloroplastic n=1 Tax=Seminavis robusta TaxID=568900 RepID=A0A9N8HRX7_9STRA|nr:NifU-like protein 1, chloroplastic [Seminavis robusta]|eukprot:Sro1638_g287720.1 NifU-like protein 1, chloroplastic (372) ;mRNA; r:4044-5426
MPRLFNLLLLPSLWSVGQAFLPLAPTKTVTSIQQPQNVISKIILQSSTDASDVSTPAPTLDGARVLPYKIMKGGLKGHTVAAVYALLNSDYKRGSEGWESVEFVGTTMDLDATLEQHVEELGTQKVANVRALTFAIPSRTAMDDWMKKWRNSALEAGGLEVEAQDYLFDDEDDDDDDGFDPEMLAAASAKAAEIVSPFDPSSAADVKAAGNVELTLTMENVDKVLDEVRPYLIADGGNVAVERVEPEQGAVYLMLEGACGSCASSTVTMSMGIERVLKENFSGFKEVIQVEDPANAGPSELTLEAVKEEFDRLYPAIVAMGGVSEILNVEPDVGVVNMKFRGSNKVRQGLELAILDLPFVNRVEFVMGEDD